MSSFPILKSFEVRNYGLYPGNSGSGLKLDLVAGLTLVLGANGLGKTTLMTMLFRMLTGPSDISIPSGSIGTAEIVSSDLGREARMTFAARVNDAARNASASLVFELGNTPFSVTRSLHDLTLMEFTRDGVAQDVSEEGFQTSIKSAAALSTFGDWILVLRTMVFFFEDRRALVWDKSAQRQLLRVLLLPPEQATRWTKAERDILQLDTRMRNLQAALRREKRDAAVIDKRVQARPAILKALSELEDAAAQLRERQEQLADILEQLDQLRHRHRLDALRAQAAHDAAIQELERARLAAIESRFPSADSSIRYILARLMADDECLVCGTVARTQKRDAMVKAIDDHRCVVCDAPMHAATEPAKDISDERIDALRSKVRSTLDSHEASAKVLEDSSASYAQTNKDLAECAADLADHKSRITGLVSQLPPEEQVARQQHEDLRSLEQRVTDLRALIREKRGIFTSEMNEHREAIRRFASGIKQAFETAAHGFLVEESELSWSPVRVQVGQAAPEGTEPVEYPAFAVELSGADFPSIVRREGPDQVSESQREFIDLAFRMALIHVAADNTAGTILIDAPESSLDAVFIDRAAGVLAGFANSNDLNRLIVTSNLAGSELIPALLIAAEKEPAKRAQRIVDLFKEGVPTRAMRQLSGEYDKYRSQLFAKIA
jgi:hypothetical protein